MQVMRSVQFLGTEVPDFEPGPHGERSNRPQLRPEPIAGPVERAPDKRKVGSSSLRLPGVSAGPQPRLLATDSGQ
jgi:hypothetical protein